MANPFAQYAPRNNAPVQVEDYNVSPPATLNPAPSPQSQSVVNEFADFRQPSELDAPAEMATWSTEVNGKVINFEAPLGSSAAQVREYAKKAGVPDPANRALKFGEQQGPTANQEMNSYGPVAGFINRGVDFVLPVTDELASGIAATFQPLYKGGNFYDNYLANMRFLEQRAANTEEQHPYATLSGKVAGVAGSLPFALGSRFLQGANWIGTSARTAAAGAPFAAANAYLSNPVDDRMNGVGEAAMLGFGIGAAAPGLTNIGVSLGRRIDQRLGISDWARRAFGRVDPETSAEQAAVDVMAARVPQSPSQMRAKAQEFRDTGHDPTLVNVVDESGRGFVAGMARRQGPGREIAQREYDARRLSMPERIDRNMQAAIDRSTSNAPAQTALQAELRRPVDEVVSDLTEKRGADIEAAMQPIRNQPVELTPDLLAALDTADGRRAISRAMRTVSDPETLAQMRSLPELVKSLRGIDPRMPPQVRAQVVDQLLKQHGGLTVDVADRLARKFNTLAEKGDTDAARILKKFGRDFRDAAKASSPEYRAAMDQYAATSKSMEAIDTGGEFVGTGNADDFARRAQNLDGTSPQPGVPSDRQRAMQGARRAVQRAAGENISTAPSVARKIAVSPEQSIRTNALFGPQNAEQLERAMGVTERDLRDFARIAPNTGSATAMNLGDDAAAAGALQAMGHAMSGNKVQAALALMRSIGVRDQDAARIVQMAVDPAQTDNLIDLLERSYDRQTAQKISRALGIPAITATSQSVGGSR